MILWGNRNSVGREINKVEFGLKDTIHLSIWSLKRNLRLLIQWGRQYSFVNMKNHSYNVVLSPAKGTKENLRCVRHSASSHTCPHSTLKKPLFCALMQRLPRIICQLESLRHSHQWYLIFHGIENFCKIFSISCDWSSINHNLISISIALHSRMTC